MHVSGLWEEVGEAGENPRRHKEKVQGQGNEQATFSYFCEAPVLTTAPLSWPL